MDVISFDEGIEIIRGVDEGLDTFQTYMSRKTDLDEAPLIGLKGRCFLFLKGNRIQLEITRSLLGLDLLPRHAAPVFLSQHKTRGLTCTYTCTYTCTRTERDRLVEVRGKTFVKKSYKNNEKMCLDSNIERRLRKALLMADMI
jgi:hypothetical protein